MLGNKDKYSLGIVLISNVSTCPSCNGKLLTKIDRPSHLIIYTETYGTVVGTHYHKYCQNVRKGYNYSQFMGIIAMEVNLPLAMTQIGPS